YRWWNTHAHQWSVLDRSEYVDAQWSTDYNERIVDRWCDFEHHSRRIGRSIDATGGNTERSDAQSCKWNVAQRQRHRRWNAHVDQWCSLDRSKYADAQWSTDYNKRIVDRRSDFKHHSRRSRCSFDTTSSDAE